MNLDDETLAQLAIFASRHEPDNEDNRPHGFHGECPWCRTEPRTQLPDDDELFMQGGSHEWAAALIAEVQRCREALFEAEAEAERQAHR